MKKVVKLAIGLFLCGTLAGKAEASNSISLKINQTPVTFEQEPIIEQDITLVPLRGIFETLGAKVDYSASTREIKANKGKNTISLKVNSSQAFINGESKQLAVPAKEIHGHTLVPLRFVSEALGAKVDWDNTNNQINIQMEGVKIKTQDEKNAEIESWIKNMNEDDKAKILDQLKQYTFDNTAKTFDEAHELAVKSFENGIYNKYRKNQVQNVSDRAKRFLETSLNYDYRTIGEDFKKAELYFYGSRINRYGINQMDPRDYLDRKIKEIKENNGVMKTFVISDDSLFFYDGNDVAVRARVYFKVNNWVNNPYDVQLNKWYQEDLEVHLGYFATNLDHWEHPDYTIDYVESLGNSMKPVNLN